MAGQQGVLELGKDGVVETEHPLHQRLARGDAGGGVAPELLVDGKSTPSPMLEARRAWRAGRRAGRGGMVALMAASLGPRGAGGTRQARQPCTGHRSGLRRPLGPRWNDDEPSSPRRLRPVSPIRLPDGLGRCEVQR